MAEGTALKAGAKGEEVHALQQALASIGIDPGRIDGVYGPQTEKAVRAFQKSVDLPADGVAGEKTLLLLLHPSLTAGYGEALLYGDPDNRYRRRLVPDYDPAVARRQRGG